MFQPATQDDQIWRALSDDRRRRIIDYLADAPRTTGDLVEAFQPLCRTAVMKHLDVLAAANLVLIRWEGRTRWNHFNPVPIDQICTRWIDKRRKRMTSALRRLKDVVELDVPKADATDQEKPQTTGMKR